jgi:formiminotetrahydrofolate cyclodeaminase
MSIQIKTVEDFRASVGGNEPVPAGVSISAVSAGLALALLAKVLDITGKRKSFQGDRTRVAELIQTARDESARLTQLADDDVRAFNEYLACDSAGKQQAMCTAIEIPMEGARSAVRGLDICAEAVSIVSGLTAADLAMAAALLRGAVRAMLVSVDFNVKQMDTAQEVVITERHELELEAVRRDDVITSAIRGLL